MIRIPLATTGLAILLAAGTPLAAADDHAGHDHAAHAHGKAMAIGTVTPGAYTAAIAATGAPAAGQTWHVELRLDPGPAAPRAIRLWVGAENGRGSVKAKAEADAAGEYSAHLEVPSPLAVDSRLWIALETADGQAAKGSLALPEAAAGHHEGDGHKH
jgi:hypothetical protein